MESKDQTFKIEELDSFQMSMINGGVRYVDIISILTPIPTFPEFD